MKICLINSLYKPYLKGGAEKVVYRLAKGLVEQGHQVSLITLGHKNEVVNGEHGAKGEMIYRVCPVNLFSFIDIDRQPAWLRFFWHLIDVFNFDGYFKVKKILKDLNPDLVLSHNLKGLGYLTPLVFKKYKWAHTVHDVQLSTPSGLIIKGFENSLAQRSVFRKIYEKICRSLFGSPVYIISPSRWLIDFYGKKGFFKNSQKIYLPNPIREISYNSNLHDHNDNHLNLLFLGQLEPHKGILFLIQALKNCDFEIEGHQINLMIGGRGSLSKQVEKIVEGYPNVKVLGYLNDEEINQVFQKTDFSVVPTLCYENSPTVIHESLGYGVPVIVSLVGGAAELIQDGCNGYSFEAGNSRDLIRVFSQAIINKKNWPDLRAKSVRTVRNFNLENYIKKLIEICS